MSILPGCANRFTEERGNVYNVRTRNGLEQLDISGMVGDDAGGEKGIWRAMVRAEKSESGIR